MMQEHYYELTITPSINLPLFIDLLSSLSDIAIEERGDSIILRDNEPLDDILWAVEEFSKKLDIPIKSTHHKKKNEDWIKKYKESIQPIEIGNFYIRPNWHQKRDDKIDIIIDPALAFGSGHHETTSSCIKVIDSLIKGGESFLDVGCGSGILSIAASKKGAIVDICDSDKLALKSAKVNFSSNSADYNRAWVGSANSTDKKYDIVMANIIADVILIIKKDLKDRVKENGILTLSGIIEKYIHKIEQNFSDFTILDHIKEGDWHTLVLNNG